ncbi:MAG: toll/interleukin-1 receptor domain-containing protein [Clostridia bacterium]|nr:toll/interleukin-1 receptor domain-containing protein [Clostridia bacterium]
MNKYKVFISYTMRENGISIERLNILKKRFNEYDFIETYIDILDNCGEDHQEYVENQLKKSDVVLLICSDGIESSEWVKKELKIAQECNIPILTLSLAQIISITDSKKHTNSKEVIKDIIKLVQDRDLQ